MLSMSVRNITLYLFKKNSFTRLFFASLALSWCYALCAQLRFFMPFNPVPVYLLPLPVFIAAFMWGRPAVYGIVLYVIQGALGAPFFAGRGSGVFVLAGPTGGYIWGYLLAAVFLACVRNYKKDAFIAQLFKLWSANCIMFFVGLVQLSFFVPMQSLLTLGLFPFIIGDYVVKTGMMLVLLNVRSFKLWQKIK